VTAGRLAPLDFVIVGAQRSASTYLNACLRDHPGIFLCRDEVPFFESPFFESTPAAALDAVFAGARPGQQRGIHRPDYLAHPECAGNIARVVPDARIVAVLRDPVARAVSAYFWYVQFGLLPLAPLDAGIERLLDGRLDPSYPRASEIVEYGFYGRHLTRFVDAFGADKVLALIDRDLADPSTLARTYEFLGVDPGHRPAPLGRPRNQGVHDLRRLRFLRARRHLAWSWDSVSVYEYRPRRLRRPLRFLPTAAIVGIDRLVLARVFRGPPPALRADLQARLRSVYEPDIRLLESLLGRDLGAWRETPAIPRPSR
jgi:hypothetical protein